MQQQQQQAYVEQANAVEQQKQTILRQILDPDAKSRLTRLKLAYPEVAHSVEEQLILLAQSGRLKKIITDEDLKTILSKVQPQKREITIRGDSMATAKHVAKKMRLLKAGKDQPKSSGMGNAEDEQEVHHPSEAQELEKDQPEEMKVLKWRRKKRYIPSHCAM